MVKKQKFGWFVHVSRSPGLAKMVLKGTLKGTRGKDRRKKRWENNVKVWTGMDFTSLARATENKTNYRKRLSRNHLMCPNNLVRLWDRLE